MVSMRSQTHKIQRTLASGRAGSRVRACACVSHVLLPGSHARPWRAAADGGAGHTTQRATLAPARAGARASDRRARTHRQRHPPSPGSPCELHLALTTHTSPTLGSKTSFFEACLAWVRGRH